VSLKDSFNFWKNYFGGKYANITFGNLISLYSQWPSSIEYDKNYDELFIKIMNNRDHITEFEKINGMIDRFCIHFENGNYVEFMVDVSISHFLDNIKMYDKNKKLLFTFEKGKPKKSIFIEFLNIFNEYIGIREGWKIDTNPASIDTFINFFDFDKNEEKKDE
jgi:hypothetical protein